MPVDVSIDAQLQTTLAAYRQRFHSAPKWAAVAPGRVNLIGEHTDYNDGFVMPMAIQRQTLIVAGPASEPNAVTLCSTSQKDEAHFSLNDKLTPGKPGWANYCKGVIAGCIDHGLAPRGFAAMIDTTVPLGGGLSSSASLEVATATLLEAMLDKQLDGVTKALICQKAEHVFANTPCGIMDQFISAMGQQDHAMLLDCRSHDRQMVPMTDPAVCVLIINSNVKHDLGTGEYRLRREECEAAARELGVSHLRDATIEQLQSHEKTMDSVVYRRARHVITENTRTTQAAIAARENRWREFGQQMVASHESLRSDFEVSCVELDILVSLAMEMGPDAGVFGSRMTGGGFGGCTVSIVDSSKAADIQSRISKAYQTRTGIEPSGFVTQAALGAHRLKLIC